MQRGKDHSHNKPMISKLDKGTSIKVEIFDSKGKLLDSKFRKGDNK